MCYNHLTTGESTPLWGFGGSDEEAAVVEDEELEPEVVRGEEDEEASVPGCPEGMVEAVAGVDDEVVVDVVLLTNARDIHVLESNVGYVSGNNTAKLVFGIKHCVLRS